MKNSKPKVSVVTITYAHEKYIEDTLRGVLMQQYDGPIEFIIANDNSPDQTDEVVKKFFDIHPIPENIEIKYTCHQENKGMMPNFIWALEQATGEYIALCEGDDYWTDPLKLQKQVDFLEENEEYGMVHTQTKFLIVADGIMKSSSTNRKDNSFDNLIYKNNIATLTTLFRSDLILRYINEISPLKEKKWVAGDLPIWLWFSSYSKIYFLDIITSVYRVIPGSMSNTITSEKYLNFVKSRYNIKKYFIIKNGNSAELLQYIKSDFLKDAEYHAIKLRDRETLVEIKEKYKSENRIKYLYFKTLIQNKFLYKFQFNIYRVFNKLFSKKKEYLF